MVGLSCHWPIYSEIISYQASVWCVSEFWLYLILNCNLQYNEICLNYFKQLYTRIFDINFYLFFIPKESNGTNWKNVTLLIAKCNWWTIEYVCLCKINVSPPGLAFYLSRSRHNSSLIMLSRSPAKERMMTYMVTMNTITQHTIRLGSFSVPLMRSLSARSRCLSRL